ncbi:MAG: YgeY family selenium metabolism-linked hydrolase [Thermoflexus sp.]|jgi:putative selenium metabolism hydrolase|nr:YgeY family selenium metabolism-linked hydrolase [Thermoflexus sp.]
MAAEIISAIQRAVEARREEILRFFFDLVAIPSYDAQIRAVGERVAEEMHRLGFEEIRFDVMGNILGRIGHGLRILVYDSHLDTVGIGDPEQWAWDPFRGRLEGDLFYARGTCDEKGSTPGMIYGLAIARDLGLLEGWTIYYFGNVEERCDGLAPNVFVEVDPKIRPDAVVIGEPTGLRVYRGHRGRVELKVIAKGRSAHAASNWLGDNAIYKMLPVIAGIRDLDLRLKPHEFLGKGTITVTTIESCTPSINAVPDKCIIYIDRRLTFGETKEEALAQVESCIPPEHQESIRVEILRYEDPSYTGFRYPVEKYFPAWALEESHPLVRAGQATIEALWGERRPTGKWDFSTNGTYWVGKAGIPSIGFGPGDETYAHRVDEHISLSEVVKATAFYALFPSVLQNTLSALQGA